MMGLAAIKRMNAAVQKDGLDFPMALAKLMYGECNSIRRKTWSPEVHVVKGVGGFLINYGGEDEDADLASYKPVGKDMTATDWEAD